MNVSKSNRYRDLNKEWRIEETNINHTNCQFNDDDQLNESSSNNNNNNNNQIDGMESKSSVEQNICEDLHAIEYRFMEILENLETKSKWWRGILIISIIFTIVTAMAWLWDVETFESSLFESLMNHIWFTISCLLLITLFIVFGIHKRVIQHNIVANRIRQVVNQFNMSCDDHGRLIMMPRPPFYNNLNNKDNYIPNGFHT